MMARVPPIWRLQSRLNGITTNRKGFDESLEEVFPGIEEEGVLLDVDPRALAAAGQKRTEGNGVGEGDRTVVRFLSETTPSDPSGPSCKTMSGHQTQVFCCVAFWF